MSTQRPRPAPPSPPPSPLGSGDEDTIFYRALCARDPRFDGRFFTGVRTTGIYCRPICPARTPLLRNVRFFPSAAAAEAAGFRPCLRCRPESAPGTPAWVGSGATVARALRLIRGGVDERGLPALAARLGIGERRLRQLFCEHIGAPPQEVVRVQRLDFARRLLDETTLPMTEVARSAGFRSIRRFNDAVKARFGKPPTLLRKKTSPAPDGDSAADPAIRGDEALVLRLPYRPPYAWVPLVGFLGARAIPGIEAVGQDGYARTFTLGDSAGWLQVRPSPQPASLELVLHAAAPLGPDLMEAVERVRTLFDLEADPLRITEHLGQDPRLAAAVVAHPGLRVPGGWDGFELAVRAILGQQVSVKGATTLCGRLVQAFGSRLELPSLPPGLTHRFPAPAALAEAELERIGIPRARAEALRQLAQRVASGRLVLSSAAAVAPTVESLLEIPGVGPWTAMYIAMRVLRDPDAFPSTDLVLRRLLDGGDAERWRPWRAYAALHLWTSVASKETSP
jgi:AraC family transcriptional regulator of adaptative response / DNA-3-methyladenine glycosylase II